MKYTTSPMLVEDGDGFKNDLLNRKNFGEVLRNLVASSNEALVISLDGKWGEGKTTFVRMWQGLLNESGIPNLYIDAFANDYVDDPFITVVSAVTSYADLITQKDKAKIDEFKEKSKRVGIQLLSWSAKMGIKAATLGIIKNSDIDELKEIKADLSKTASDFAAGIIEKQIASHKENVANVSAFKRLLSELPSEFQDGGNKPLVIIIDELDRCRPTFAVELIEKIKHLFAVDNIVFLLVINTSQLEESIKCVYGQNIDANTYLQKFIHIEAKLPKQTGSRGDNDLKTYAAKLLASHQLDAIDKPNIILDCVDILANNFNLSLRQLEKVFTNLALIYSSHINQRSNIVPIIVFLACVKVIEPTVFDDLLNRRLSYSEVQEKLRLPALDSEDAKNKKLYMFLKWIKFSLISEIEFNALRGNDEIKTIAQNLWDVEYDRESLIPFFAQKLSLFNIRE